jgi:hypothetical protein
MFSLRQVTSELGRGLEVSAAVLVDLCRRRTKYLKLKNRLSSNRRSFRDLAITRVPVEWPRRRMRRPATK